MSILADLLDGDINLKNKQKYIWRQFSFTYLPIELFSRLYEQFLGFDSKNAEFTPPHLAKFLVDECMPINTAENIPNPLNYKILDPSCGSGVFLVIAFKRLIQWYRIKNNYTQEIEIEVLKNILRNNIYGVELKSDAANLAIFSLSLALCDFCNPSKLWTELHFDNIRGRNIYEADFFDWIKTNTNEFDLVIGNPPFNEEKKSEAEKQAKKSIKGEPKIALRFLRDSMKVLKDGGLQCLIVKSSEILHNSTSKDFRINFFKTYQVAQIIDFTCLTEILWSVARVPTVAIFTIKSIPNNNINILHAVIKQSQAINSKLFFELDEYDLQYVTQQEALENHYIWKINLLGGGRIKQLVSKFSKFETLEEYLTKNKNSFNLSWGEGADKGEPTFISEALSEYEINYSKCNDIDKINTPIKHKSIFEIPNLIIRQIISKKDIIPMDISEKYLTFRKHTMAISSNNDGKLLLEKIKNIFKINKSIYKFLINTQSPEILIRRNSAFLKDDFFKLPLIESTKLSVYEEGILT